MSEWLEYQADISAELADRLEEVFCEELQSSWMLTFDSARGTHELIGFFADERAADVGRAELQRKISDLPSIARRRSVPESDWETAYRKHFSPWSDRGLHFVPVWQMEEYTVPAGESVIYLDPGMAFGTGNHETTRLCLRRLIDLQTAGRVRSGSRVVDAGCGSGILSIAARKLGVIAVRGFDSDPDAVEIAMVNAKRDEVEAGLSFRWGNLSDELVPGEADLLLANIIGEVLEANCASLVSAVAPGGSIVMSGVLGHQIGGFRRKFLAEARRLWGSWPENNTRTEGTWADLWMRRPGNT